MLFLDIFASVTRFMRRLMSAARVNSMAAMLRMMHPTVRLDRHHGTERAVQSLPRIIRRRRSESVQPRLNVRPRLVRTRRASFTNTNDFTAGHSIDHGFVAYLTNRVEAGAVARATVEAVGQNDASENVAEQMSLDRSDNNVTAMETSAENVSTGQVPGGKMPHRSGSSAFAIGTPTDNVPSGQRDNIS